MRNLGAHFQTTEITSALLNCKNKGEMDRTEGYPLPMNVPATPAGLEAIYKACRRLYPTQPNPLQVTAVVKYW